MANYSSYRKFGTDSMPNEVVPETAICDGAGAAFGVKWIYNERGLRCHQCSNNGDCCEQANGKCCLWTVPAGVTQVTFEIWSGGGGGAGHTCCNCCSFTIGGAGGNYAVKSIATVPGCQYRICAGGSWRCEKSHTCDAGEGCTSYVNGYNLSNFCVVGGCGGWMCNGDAWGPRTLQSCANQNICGMFGADFGIMGTTGFRFGFGACHCNRLSSVTGTAPIIGKMMANGGHTWCSCGCYVNWPAGGGMSGASSYCNNWAKACAGGGQGGSGVVRITYM
jgi:hypothetical protein